MLTKISFVGVDELTDTLELISMEANTKGFYGIEAGVLYSLNNAGIKPRYPSLKFIESFPKRFKHSGVGTSIHLCGSQIIKEFLSKKIDKKFLQQFNRLQININAKTFIEENSSNLEELYNSITESVNYYDKTCIFQNKEQNIELNEKIRQNCNNLYSYRYNFLYDSSGGASKEIEIIKEPFGDFYTGYAGGLNPSNVVEIVNKIDNLNPSNRSYYIDMESGIRTDDRFDILKCKKIISSLIDYEVGYVG